MVEHMKTTGMDMSKHNFTVESVDKNNDGAIKFNEFLAMMSAFRFFLSLVCAHIRAALGQSILARSTVSARTGPCTARKS